MPGSVANAVSATVMPWEIARSFRRTQAYDVLGVDYSDGHSERSVRTATSRKRWDISKRLNPAELNTLRDFYNARGGPHETFIFYDVYETAPLFTFDPTGVASAGKFEVRFDGEFAVQAGIALSDAGITLIEVT